MLVQVALIVFALCAMLSLLIDLGYARMTQASMQNAADTAALEGLRKRNVGVVVNPATGARVDDAFGSDCLRRASANRFVRWTFDDDFSVTNGDPDQFGAGPIIDLTDPITELDAGGTVQVTEARAYKPDLQLNQQNAVHGDMVSGQFVYSAEPGASEDFAYARTDFTPRPNGPPPPPSLPVCPPADEPVPVPWPAPPNPNQVLGVNDTAFLVRLRRSNDLRGFDGQTEPGVATSGPSLPLTFGKAALISGDPSSTYSPRRDGLTVRATAIAEVRPALQVGLPQASTTPALQGVTPFALLDACVQNLNPPPPPNLNGYPVTINPATGSIMASSLMCTGTGTTAATAVIGRFVDNLTDPTRSRWLLVSTVGRTLPAPTPVACAAITPFAGYGPVYSQMSTSGANRIIGFTRIGLIPDPIRPTDPCAKRITRGASVVAASNATANLIGGLPLPVGAQPAEVAELVDKNLQNLARPGVVTYGPVLVPVLVR